jgi:hypothetical protein
MMLAPLLRSLSSSTTPPLRSNPKCRMSDAGLHHAKFTLKILYPICLAIDLKLLSGNRLIDVEIVALRVCDGAQTYPPHT